MKRAVLLVCLFASAPRVLPPAGAGGSLPRLRVSDNHRFLVRADGRPFFWLGDTAWALHQNLKRADVLRYLDDAQAKRFTVIQLMSVNLWALHDGTNASGEAPYLEGEPWKLNLRYWKYLDWVIDEAATRNLYVLLVIGAPGREDGHGPFCRSPEEAYRYGHALGALFRNKTNLVWGVGMDVNPDDSKRVAPMGFDGWRAMAEGVTDGVSGEDEFDGRAEWDATLMTYHPRGGSTSALWFHRSPWLDFNGAQVGLRPTNAIVRTVSTDYGRRPAKPIVDLEPWYEGATWKKPPVDAWEVRLQAWQSVFAGAFGHTYGSGNIYGFDSSVEGGKGRWRQSLDLPGRVQMKNLRKLMESFPVPSRVPLESFVVGSDDGGHESLDVRRRISATGGTDTGYALVYTPRGEPFTVDLSRLGKGRLVARWFDPRTGQTRDLGRLPANGRRRFDPPGRIARGNDWALVLSVP